jgi:alpha-L-arabinofuranosidase
MKRLLNLVCIGFSFCVLLKAQSSEIIKIQVNAAKKIATVSELFNGTNIEDLNHQTNGGIFSQLLMGEAFEESVDIDFLKLPVSDYVKLCVIIDEMRRPNIALYGGHISTNNLNDLYDINSSEINNSLYPAPSPNSDPVNNPARGLNRIPVKIGPFTFYGNYVAYDSIPVSIRTELDRRANGEEQISRCWAKMISGSANGRYILQRGNAYMGRQDQIIMMEGGQGEFGLINKGLNKQGIRFISGKPYEGVLRIKADSPAKIYLSIRDENGKTLAENPYSIRGDGSWEKVSFELTPTGNSMRGGFGIALKEKGRIELGFAFLESGPWGRVPGGYHLRKEFADALIKQGIKVIRYNGSMIDQGVDKELFRWKNFYGPIDERRICFRSGFNPYATTSFGPVELCQFAEAIGATAVIGMNQNENYEDIHDFVEYMNGSNTTRWGAKRAADGHPAPYNLKYIEVDNEVSISVAYNECIKKFARAAWEADPAMHIAVSVNIGSNMNSFKYNGEQYLLAKELFRWFIEQGKPDNLVWDAHYSGSRNFADSEGFRHEMAIDLQEDLFKDLGVKLTLSNMEENGSRCDWDRGLAHAHNWNSLQRLGAHFKMLATANTFQPYNQYTALDQGRVQYTSDAMWFMPSAYIDEKISHNWLFNVVEATSSEPDTLDVTAKLSDDGKTMELCVVNLAGTAKNALINLNKFVCKPTAESWMIGDCALKETNTYENQTKVVPVIRQIKTVRTNWKYTFPKYSYTIITLKQ